MTCQGYKEDAAIFGDVPGAGSVGMQWIVEANQLAGRTPSHEAMKPDLLCFAAAALFGGKVRSIPDAQEPECFPLPLPHSDATTAAPSTSTITTSDVPVGTITQWAASILAPTSISTAATPNRR